MAFTVYEVVRVAYQSRSWFVLYAQLRDRRATRTTSLILKAMQRGTSALWVITMIRKC